MVTSNRRWGLRWRTYACRRATALMRSHGRFTLRPLIGPPMHRSATWALRSSLRCGARSSAIGLLRAGRSASLVGQMEEHGLEVVAAEAGGDRVGRAVGH